MGYIKSVVPREDYKLKVTMDNGNSLIIGMKSKLDTIRFGMLANKEVFDTVTTDGRCIKWQDKIEISVNEIFQMAQK